MLACPRCLVPLGACACVWPEQDGLLDLYTQADQAGERPEITAVVRDFYEEHPFPNYRDTDELGALVRAGRGNAFLRALDQGLPAGASVVEVGCGTGQLSNFLAAGGRRVLGLDLSLASLRLAEGFRRRAGLHSARFARANLFCPPVLPGSVDVVIAQGVLHHTGAPRRALGVLKRLLRPGGYLVFGLYNRYGRALLPLLRRRHALAAGEPRGDAWLHDQHHHPEESRHTADEVLGWLDGEALRYVSSVPPITLSAPPDDLFAPQPRGGALERLLAQLGWLGRAADGGLWITVARRMEAG